MILSARIKQLLTIVGAVDQPLLNMGAFKCEVISISQDVKALEKSQTAAAKFEAKIANLEASLETAKSALKSANADCKNTEAKCENLETQLEALQGELEMAQFALVDLQANPPKDEKKNNANAKQFTALRPILNEILRALARHKGALNAAEIAAVTKREIEILEPQLDFLEEKKYIRSVAGGLALAPLGTAYLKVACLMMFRRAPRKHDRLKLP
jgi:chromosome segregation ATPase